MSKGGGWRCTVCAHPRHDYADEQLAGESNLHALAAELGLTRQSIIRHRRNHLLGRKPPLRDVRPEPMPPEPAKRKHVRKIYDQTVDQARKTEFLNTFQLTGDLLAAFKAADITRYTLQQWQEHDEQFGLKYQQARLELIDTLEAAAIERATTGSRLVRKVYRNNVLYEEVHEWRPSDAALIKLLTALKPDVYGEKLAVTQTTVVKTMDQDAWESV